MPNSIDRYRSGQRAIGEKRAEPRSGHDLGCVPGEDIGVLPGVVADQHRTSSQAAIEQIAGQSCGGLADDYAVHPAGTRTKRPPQAGRAELEPTGEGVGQLRHGSQIAGSGRADKLVRLRSGDRVRILPCPGGDRAQQVTRESLWRRHRTADIPANSVRSRGAAF
jgi:hypothetical protein